MTMETIHNRPHLHRPAHHLPSLAVALFAIGLAANGLWMLVSPASWYTSAPSPAQTGPFNAYFVRDVGIAFLTCAVAYVLALISNRHRVSLLVIPAVFLGLHAGLTLFQAILHAPPVEPAAIATTIGPGLVAVALVALPSQ